jgi:D-alanine-D-alanine ligase-like ATP-grasp enzyme
MAIFSQNDPKTQIDFRNYNNENPNRNIPFKLPKKIEKKLKKIIKIKQLDSCSIDLIVTPENEFVFLEINPQGQFEWISYYCNYHIEKKIANHIS